MFLVLLAVLPAFGLALNNASEERRLATVQVEKDALQLAWAISDHHNELIENGRKSLFPSLNCLLCMRMTRLHAGNISLILLFPISTTEMS
jgi:hypothetical protein